MATNRSFLRNFHVAKRKNLVEMTDILAMGFNPWEWMGIL
jgi:hypothetical protein